MKTKKLFENERLASQKIRVNDDLTLEHIRCLDSMDRGILWHSYLVNDVEVDREEYFKTIMSIQRRPLKTDTE